MVKHWHGVIMLKQEWAKSMHNPYLDIELLHAYYVLSFIERDCAPFTLASPLGFIRNCDQDSSSSPAFEGGD